MTKEELLIPRWQVQGSYPHSPYSLGDLVHTTKRGTYHLTTTNYNDEFGNPVNQQNYFPISELENNKWAFFIKLRWYQIRDTNEFTNYLIAVSEYSSQNIFGDIKIGNVVKVKKYYTTDVKLEGYKNVYPLHMFHPATEEDYLNYTNNLK